MLAKLLALLMQSKLAAVSTAFVLGTTGALVGATTHDGLTTAASPEANEQTETPQSDAVLTNALGTRTTAMSTSMTKMWTRATRTRTRLK